MSWKRKKLRKGRNTYYSLSKKLRQEKKSNNLIIANNNNHFESVRLAA